MRQYLIAIDPGTTQSGVCLVRTEDYKPLWCAKVNNSFLGFEINGVLNRLNILLVQTQIVIERMQGNNMPVSSDVFLTCEWIGRFDVIFKRETAHDTDYVFRREEYKNLCSNIYSRNDSGIRSALVDRFAYGMENFGKGTKKKPGWFYGFGKDMWSAYAIAVTFLDRERDKP